MVAPNSTYVPMFPLQEQFWDKDLNVPLAGGTVEFYSDPGFTISKDIYAQNQSAPYDFVIVSSVQTLSIIGTFTNGGSNFIPFMWPYQGNPATPPNPLVAEPYFIRVFNSDGVPQFTVSDWPPNITGTITPPAASGVIVKTYTTGITTWVAESTMVYVTFECIGGGGGGGGCTSPTSTHTLGGGGGGAGAYSKRTLSLANSGSSQTVTVGAGGAGGAAGAFNGTPGNPTSVGVLCIAPAGSGGLYANDAQQPVGGAGGPLGTGDIAGIGESGFFGISGTINTLTFGAGTGGSTLWGGGGVGRAPSLANPGANGSGYGAGASGGIATTGQAAQPGGTGANGFVIITEYLST